MITPKFPKKRLIFAPSGLFSLSPTLPANSALLCTCCFLDVAMVWGWLPLDVQQGPSSFLELLHWHLVLSQVSLQLLFSQKKRQNQRWVLGRILTVMELRAPFPPSEGSSALGH